MTCCETAFRVLKFCSTRRLRHFKQIVAAKSNYRSNVRLERKRIGQRKRERNKHPNVSQSDRARPNAQVATRCIQPLYRKRDAVCMPRTITTRYDESIFSLDVRAAQLAALDSKRIREHVVLVDVGEQIVDRLISGHGVAAGSVNRMSFCERNKLARIWPKIRFKFKPCETTTGEPFWVSR